MTFHDLVVNAERLLADLRDLSVFGRNAGGGIDRASFSAADATAREWLAGRCAEAGLEVMTDAVGNIFVSSPRLEEGIAHHPAVWTGSHIDAVPDGGAFDGALGVIAAIEVLRTLHEAGTGLTRPVRAVSFSDEEGSFAHLFGSSAIARGFGVDQLEAMIGRDGARLAEALPSALTVSLADAAAVGPPPEGVAAYVELHIEQGSLLEASGVPIGVVTGIVAIGGGTVRFRGRADHAGTTPLDRRQDAGLAASEFAVALPALASATSADAVVTTGIMRFDPAGSNIVPGGAEVSVDFRDVELERAIDLGNRIAASASEIASRRGVGVEIEFEETVPGARMNDAVRGAIAGAAAGLGLDAIDIRSGAGHDAQNMALIAPTGMIFVPSVGGRSHSPAEYTRDDDVVRGASVLLRTVLALVRG
ncbi:M20 family metallo-hydrolase [Microbacterium sp. CPCC 204701]|uniref:M20 family metallo-hydrolase n=1 Tax=Microbacterium sp. CPCC 204701 TaxID=2493084 RepID=UPI000FD96A5B|nr:M20 family metallo-hydrolase [Microbacterium sp. CPCC 204701]